MANPEDREQRRQKPDRARGAGHRSLIDEAIRISQRVSALRAEFVDDWISALQWGQRRYFGHVARVRNELPAHSQLGVRKQVRLEFDVRGPTVRESEGQGFRAPFTVHRLAVQLDLRLRRWLA
jgi:hypothetical protein